MKLKVVIFFLFLLATGFAVAQGGNTKVEALRVAFISKRLELSTAEAEKFWPVYNEYTDKMQAIKRNLRQAYKRKPEPLTEKDAEELYKLDLQSQQAEADTYRQYSEKLKAIIGVKRMVVLRVAEEDFRKELIKTIKGGGGD